MSSMSLDKPLDEIIKANPRGASGKKGRGGGRGGAAGPRRSGGGAKAAAVGARAQQAVVKQAAARGPRGNNTVIFPSGSKVVISNLPFDVSEGQVRELFGSTIGPLKRIVMSYKANGTSTGICNVEFQRSDDANKAYKMYNGRLIDGKRPLTVEVVVDPARAAALAAQQAQAARLSAAPGPKKAAAPAAAAAGAKAGGKRGRAKKEPRAKKTTEDLDAEMEDYAKTNAPAS